MTKDKRQFTLILVHVPELFFHEQWDIASYGIPSLAHLQSDTVTATFTVGHCDSNISRFRRIKFYS